jgi:hypothetical protein
MPEFRFSVPGVPPEPAKGITAFAPHANRHAGSGAQQFKQAVRGYPGTRAIPQAARRDSQISPDYGDLSQAGTSRSSDAPDAIWPNQYYQVRATEEAGGNAPSIQMYQPQFPGLTTTLPIPAEDGRNAWLAQSALLAQPGPLNRAGVMPQLPRFYSPPVGTWNG